MSGVGLDYPTFEVRLFYYLLIGKVGPIEFNLRVFDLVQQ